MNNYDLTNDEAGVFFEEANELLESLDRDLVTMEQDVDDELINRVFRAIHTLKGTAGSIGHDPMASLAHAAETLLEKVRNHELGVSTTMANLLFQVVENLRKFLEDVVNDTPSDVDVNGLILQLKQELSGDSSTDSQHDMPKIPLMDDDNFAMIDEGLKGGMNLLVVYAEADPTGIAPMARLLQMYMHVEQIAQIIVSSPTGDELEHGDGASSLVLVAITDLERAEFESELSDIFEIVSLQVADLSNAIHLLREQAEQSDLLPEQTSDDASPSVILANPPKSTTLTKADGLSTEKAAPHSGFPTSRTVRTSIERLDNLMNLAGELVTDRNRLFQIYEDLSDVLDDEQLMALNDLSTHLSSVADRIHDEVFKARMQPIEYVFNKFPRFVRQICQDLGKEVDLVVMGQETEVDRSLIEQVGDPILHLVRNAIDHGVETIDDRLAAGKTATGRLELSARSEESNIVISIVDDGKGIDAEKVKRKATSLGLITQEQAAALSYHEAIDLIFAPGLSTAENVSDLSGRGVGMDVVRTNIQRLNGTVVVYSTPGAGTTFELRLPLTLAIIPTLLVEVEDHVFALPLPNVFEIFKLESEMIQSVRGRETTSVRGEVLPLVRLAHLFAGSISAAQKATNLLAKEEPAEQNDWAAPGYVVSVSYRDARIGVIVSGLLGKQDVVIKSLGYPINNVRGLTGATLLGDGRIGLIVDVAALVSMSMDVKGTLAPVV